MWVRSQNRKYLVKCNIFYIDEKYGKEGPLYWIIGLNSDCSEEGSGLLGIYDSLSTALDVLCSIEGRIVAKCPVFEMPVDKEDES